MAYVFVLASYSGTTALLAFMAMHVNLHPNRFLRHPPYEEVQFFSNSAIYSRGVAYYNDRFAKASTRAGDINFEKSATYFDSPLAAQRMYALLPNAKVIILLRDPLLRARSWYEVGAFFIVRLVSVLLCYTPPFLLLQHQIAHNVSAALSFTFDQVLQADSMGKSLSLAKSLGTAYRGNISQLAEDLYLLNKKCIYSGFYASHLRRWLHFYPANHVS